jgi:hypothetical protein
MLKRYSEEALEESAAPMSLRRRTISTAPAVCRRITGGFILENRFYWI